MVKSIDKINAMVLTAQNVWMYAPWKTSILKETRS